MARPSAGAFTTSLLTRHRGSERATSRRFQGGDRVISMNLDLNKLFLVTIYVEAIPGLLLLLDWIQNAQIVAVAWWGFADLSRAGSVLLFGLYGSAPELI